MTDSAYTLPVFISSTDYNLVDLRCELQYYLSELGCRPFLSSAEGFHDHSPRLQPWESCLPVVESCFLVVLVIDSRYGQKLEWKNAEEFIGQRLVSPTHGEYLYAHSRHKRILVFVREGLMQHYETYRNIIKVSKNDDERESLLKAVPDRVDVDVLRFIEEVKTTRPIPWITTFKSVLDVKRELKLKLFNELTEVFMAKSQNIEAAIRLVGQAFEGMEDKEKQEFLSKTPIRAIIEHDQVELAAKNRELEELNNKISNSQEAERKNIAEEKRRLEGEITKLRGVIDGMQTDKGKIERLSNALSADRLTATYIPTTSADTAASLWNTSIIFGSCGKCGKGLSSASATTFSQCLPCSECGKTYCADCWPRLLSIGTKCPACTAKEHSVFLPVMLSKCDGCGERLDTPTQPFVLYNQNRCPKCNKWYCQKCWPNWGNSFSLGNKCPECTRQDPFQYTVLTR